MSAKYTNIFVTLLSICAATHAVYSYFKNKKVKLERKDSINDVIMFSQSHISTYISSRYSPSKIPPSMDCLLHYLSLPQYSLDICMHIITSAEICNIILHLNTKKVKIRLIVDNEMAKASSSIVRNLKDVGIHVHCLKSPFNMHHKFCIIDASANDSTSIVLMGSLNWTRSALFENYENVLVTSNSHIVHKYKEHFEKLWLQFVPTQ